MLIVYPVIAYDCIVQTLGLWGVFALWLQTLKLNSQRRSIQKRTREETSSKQLGIRFGKFRPLGSTTKLKRAQALRLEKGCRRQVRQAWFRHWRWRQARITHFGNDIDDIDDTNRYNDDIDDNTNSQIYEQEVENSDNGALARILALHVTLHVLFEQYSANIRIFEQFGYFGRFKYSRIVFANSIRIPVFVANTGRARVGELYNRYQYILGKLAL